MECSTGPLAWWIFVGGHSTLFQQCQEMGMWCNQVQRDGGVAHLIAAHESEPCCKKCADGLLDPGAVCWSKADHHSDNAFKAERDPSLGASSFDVSNVRQGSSQSELVDSSHKTTIISYFIWRRQRFSYVIKSNNLFYIRHLLQNKEISSYQKTITQLEDRVLNHS